MWCLAGCRRLKSGEKLEAKDEELADRYGLE